MARQQAEQESGDKLTAILEQLVNNAPVPEIGYGHPKYQERLKAEGFLTDFAAPVYQNGKEAQTRGLKPETIERAPKLRPGKYLGGKIEVMRDNRDRVHLLYKSRETRDVIEMERLLGGGGFDAMIEKIWTEMHAA